MTEYEVSVVIEADSEQEARYIASLHHTLADTKYIVTALDMDSNSDTQMDRRMWAASNESQSLEKNTL